MTDNLPEIAARQTLHEFLLEVLYANAPDKFILKPPNALSSAYRTGCGIASPVPPRTTGEA
jgi:hypothetical protein